MSPSHQHSLAPAALSSFSSYYFPSLQELLTQWPRKHFAGPFCIRKRFKRAHLASGDSLCLRRRQRLGWPGCWYQGDPGVEIIIITIIIIVTRTQSQLVWSFESQRRVRSNGVGKSEMIIIWCISITNNVKSYKKNHWNSSNNQFQWFPIDFLWHWSILWTP